MFYLFIFCPIFCGAKYSGVKKAFYGVVKMYMLYL